MILFAVDPAHALELLHYDLEPAAVSLRWVRQVSRGLQGTRGRLKVHLWVDTGLGREGVMPGDALPLARQIQQSKHLQLRGIATHLCCVQVLDRVYLARNDLRSQTVVQRQRFDQVVKELRAAGLGRNALLHVGASDVVRYRLAPLYYDLVRVGCMLIQNPRQRPRNYRWQTKIRQIKILPKGWCLDYGCRLRTERVTRVALLTHLPLQDLVYTVRGKAAKVLLHHGYAVMLDITHIPRAAEGDPVSIGFKQKDGVLSSSAPLPVTIMDTQQ
jgi:alanine racemase